jgi:uncharacterized membrane protein
MRDNKTVDKLEREAEELAASGKRLMNKDRYVLVFVLVMATIIVNAFLSQGVLGMGLVFTSLTLTLVVTLVTSEAERRTLVSAGFLVAVIFAVAIVAQLVGQQTVTRFAYKFAVISMGLIVPAVIGRRILQHPTVTLNTVAGAADIYLMFGFVFAAVYSFVGDAILLWQPQLVANLSAATTPAQAFFIGGRVPVPSDFLYYSFVTLTTVGYGDLTASTGVGRMLSVTEALLGQLYLVTVVAVLVSNIGGRRGDTKEAAF